MVIKWRRPASVFRWQIRFHSNGKIVYVYWKCTAMCLECATKQKKKNDFFLCNSELTVGAALRCREWERLPICIRMFLLPFAEWWNLNRLRQNYYFDCIFSVLLHRMWISFAIAHNKQLPFFFLLFLSIFLFLILFLCTYYRYICISVYLFLVSIPRSVFVVGREIYFIVSRGFPLNSLSV